VISPRSLSRRQYRCRLCGCELPAWLPVAKRPDGAMLLHHLGQDHPDQLGPYLERMRTEDIAKLATTSWVFVEWHEV
jgi:hypothetical protein